MNDLLKKIDAIIFDFGNVLLDLDYDAVMQGFSDVASKNKNEIKEMVVSAPLLQNLEIGAIDPHDFFKGIRKLLGTDASDFELAQIWDSVLNDLSISRMKKLLDVGEKYQTYILSNTNIIHEMTFNRMIKGATGKDSLHDFVNKVYFSHEIGLRKPDVACYQYVIDDIGTDPSRMIFLDDRIENLEGAQQAGLNVLHITNPDQQFAELFGE